MGHPARSNSTARRGRNHLEFFKTFMQTGTEMSTLSMGQSIFILHDLQKSSKPKRLPEASAAAIRVLWRPNHLVPRTTVCVETTPRTETYPVKLCHIKFYY